MRRTAGWVDVGFREERPSERSLNVAGAGTILLQNFVNRTITALVLRHQGVFSTLPRKPGVGAAAIVNRRTPGTTSADQAQIWVNDTSEPPEDQGVYDQLTVTYRTALQRGKVTRKLQATGRNYADVLAQEMAFRADDFRYAVEVALVQGDNAANALQMSGLLTLINAYNNQSQNVANTTATAGDAISMEKVDEFLDIVVGSDNHGDMVIFGSLKGRRKLNAALQAQQAFNDRTEIAAGFRVRSYDDIPIISTTGMPDTITLATGGKRILSWGAGGTTALIAVNTNYVWIEELTPITVSPLSKMSSQYDAFDIYWDGALVIHNPLGASLLTAIN